MGSSSTPTLMSDHPKGAGSSSRPSQTARAAKTPQPGNHFAFRLRASDGAGRGAPSGRRFIPSTPASSHVAAVGTASHALQPGKTGVSTAHAKNAAIEAALHPFRAAIFIRHRLPDIRRLASAITYRHFCDVRKTQDVDSEDPFHDP